MREILTKKQADIAIGIFRATPFHIFNNKRSTFRSLKLWGCMKPLTMTKIKRRLGRAKIAYVSLDARPFYSSITVYVGVDYKQPPRNVKKKIIQICSKCGHVLP